MSRLIKNLDSFFFRDEDKSKVYTKLPAGTYTIDVMPMTDELFFREIDDYTVGKLYGDVEKTTTRMLNTFFSRENSTGVLLTGEKGCGKTLLAKNISIRARDMDVPTIVINRAFAGEHFNMFIQKIDQPAIIIFDEFEKVYNDVGSQEKLLTLLDGLYPSKKMFIMTTNSKYNININMLNRPGRLFYNVEYKGLDTDFVREYCQDTLDNKNDIETVARVSELFENFNFDMLKAIVEEMNRYKENAFDAIKLMNVKTESNNATYTVTAKTETGEDLELSENKIRVNPFSSFHVYVKPAKVGLSLVKYEDDDDDEWKSIQISPENLVSIAGGVYVYKLDNNVYKLTRKLDYELDTSRLASAYYM